jgi:hypothetical protein
MKKLLIAFSLLAFFGCGKKSIDLKDNNAVNQFIQGNWIADRSGVDMSVIHTKLLVWGTTMKFYTKIESVVGDGDWHEDEKAYTFRIADEISTPAGSASGQCRVFIFDGDRPTGFDDLRVDNGEDGTVIGFGYNWSTWGSFKKMK